MDNKKVNVQVELMAEDIYRFQKSLVYKKGVTVLYGIISVFLIVYAIMVLSDGTESYSKIARIIPLLIIPIVISVVLPIWLKRGAETALRTNKLLQKTQNYSIDNEGLEITSDAGKSFIKWSDLHKAIETKENFQFFTSKNQAYIIPKRCLDMEADYIIKLRELMKNSPIPKDEKKLLKRPILLGVVIYFALFIFLLLVLVLFQSSN